MKNQEDIIKFCESSNRIYCYGAGNRGRMVKVYLDECDINVSGFIVSKDEKDYYGKVLDTPVYSLSCVTENERDDIGILVCADEKYKEEIVCNLKEHGQYNYLCISEDAMREINSQILYREKYHLKNNINVFVYHRVNELHRDTWKLAITKELFEKQIQYITSNYQVIRAEDVWEDSEKTRAVITFDDGYADFCSNALPILEKYNVPATIFVSTGNLNSDGEFWWDKLERIIFERDENVNKIKVFDYNIPLVTEEEQVNACYFLHPYLKRMSHEKRELTLKKMATELHVSLEGRTEYRSMTYEELKKVSKSSYVTIGGHTVTHSCLANENETIQEWEISESKTIIENIIGKKITVFSYPFGQVEDFTEETIEIAKKVGYDKIFAAYAGLTNSGYVNGKIPRNNIGQVANMYEAEKQIRMIETLFGDDYL